MKKLLLIAAATAALSTSAMADDMGMAGSFYLRGDLSTMKFQNFTDKDTNLKVKSKWNAGLDLGVGYNVMDNVRSELVWVHAFNPEAKKAGTSSYGTQVRVKHKGTADAIMLKGAVDVADLGMAQLFVDGGLGWGIIKEKITWTDSTVSANSGSVTSKKANTLAWTLGVGGGFDVADGVRLDLQYAYTDFGKTKSAKITGYNPELAKDRYRAHAIKFGVRFDI